MLSLSFMKTNEEKKVDKLESDIAHAGNAPLAASEVSLGVMSGAVVGSMAGLPGAVVGALIGGAAGAIGAVISSEESHRKDQREEGLDAEIGVSGGEMGAPNLDHPPPSRGTYSASSAGAAGGATAVPAEGPSPPPEEDG
jgi:hypothetical protein